MKIRTLDIDELNERLAELEDKRDLIATREEELNECKEALATDPEVAGVAESVDDAQASLDSAKDDFDKDEQAELTALETLKDEIGERRGKISHEGGPYVDERDFEDYAREIADDIGAIDKDAGWPCNCIDWDQAARELKMDYSSVEWQGDTYLYRS